MRPVTVGTWQFRSDVKLNDMYYGSSAVIQDKTYFMPYNYARFFIFMNIAILMTTFDE